YLFFFFFQAEDGIRDFHVTGVQTCALPILLCSLHLHSNHWLPTNDPEVNNGWSVNASYTAGQVKVSEIAAIVEEGDYMILSNNRSEERRVGKEYRARL